MDNEVKYEKIFAAFRREDHPLCLQALHDLDITPDKTAWLADTLKATWERTNPKDILVDISDNIGDLNPGVEIGLAYFLQGILYNRMGQTAKSFAAFQSAEQLANAVNSPIFEIEIGMERGVVLAWLGQFEAALNGYLRVVTLAIDACYEIGQAVIWAKIGQLFGEYNDHEQSLYYLRLAKKNGGMLLPTRFQINMAIEMAEKMHMLGQREDAQALIKALDPASTEACDQYTKFKLGLMELKFSDSEEKAIDIAHGKAQGLMESDDAWQEAALAAALGEALITIKPAKAIPSLEQAEEYFRQRGLISHLWRCLILQARCLVKLDSLANAEAMMRAAREIAFDQGNERLIELTDNIRETLGLTQGLDLRQNVKVSNDYNKANNGYATLELIGSGGYGEVYRAFDMLQHKEVALKKFRNRNLSMGEVQTFMEDTIKRELISAAKLRHPAIVGPTSFGTADDGSFYTTSRFIKGKPLRSFMTGQPSPMKLLKYLAPIIGALDYAHSKGAVHRDIKPENIMIDESSNSLLVDFGTASLSEGIGDIAAKSGTRPYMAPEHQRGHDAAPEMDSFSLAVIIYEWLMGEKPFADHAPTGRAAYWWQNRKMSAKLKTAEIPADISYLLLQAFSYHAKKRPDMGAFNASMKAAYQAHPK